MTAAALTGEAERAIPAPRRGRATPGAYLVAAICVAVIAVMAAPMALSFLASIKTAADASAVPPHYLPQASCLFFSLHFTYIFP